MLTVLGGLAEFEREVIKARTAEGRKRAQARGVRFGRKLKLSRHQILEALARREAEEALTEIGRSFGVSHSAISRLRDFATEERYCTGRPVTKFQVAQRNPTHAKGFIA
jgi:DNA invertase Pin-like site-specific DNA recombinase